MKTMQRLRDLWTHEEADTLDSYAAEVPAHGVVLLRVYGL
jgi:hypothetical protein